MATKSISSFADIPKDKWSESAAQVHLKMLEINKSGNQVAISEAAQEYKQYDSMVAEAVHTGHIDEINLDEVGSLMARQDSRFRDGWSAMQNYFRDGSLADPAIAEHLFDGMDASQFPDLVQRCVVEKALTGCSSNNCGSLVDLIGTMSVGCNEERMRSDLMLDDLDFGVCEAPDSPLTFAGVNSPIYTRIGPRCKKRIGFSLKSNLRCNNLMGAVEDVINNNVKKRYDKHYGKQVVEFLTNGCGGPTCQANDYRPYIDECQYNLYYENGGGGPWQNKFCNDQDLNPCTGEALLCRLERQLRRATDPWTGDFIDCCDRWDVIAFGDACSTKTMRKLLGAQDLTYKSGCEADTCTTERRYTEAARAGWGTITNNSCLTRTLFEQYQAKYGAASGHTLALDDCQVMQMVDRTFVVGCPKSAIFRTVEQDWTKRTYGGTNTWMFFNQGVEEMMSFEISTGFFVNPMTMPGTMLVQGLPDGVTCADLCA
jgi:hypothetical protein